MSRRRDWLVYALTALVSAATHVGLLGGLSSAARSAPRAPRLVEMTLNRPPPPPPPVEPPAPVPQPVEAPAKRPPPPKKLEPLPPQPPPEQPPPPNTEQAPAAEARPVFGISMSSTVGPGTSGFSVRVGNTLMKEPEKERTDPASVQPYAAPKAPFVPVYEVSEMPARKGECREPYPEEARRLRVEGRVQLDVEVKADGSVGEVKIVQGALGHGLEDTAVRALKRCRFSPARKAGEAVATRILYWYTFTLDE